MKRCILLCAFAMLLHAQAYCYVVLLANKTHHKVKVNVGQRNMRGSYHIALGAYDTKYLDIGTMEPLTWVSAYRYDMNWGNEVIIAESQSICKTDAEERLNFTFEITENQIVCKKGVVTNYSLYTRTNGKDF